VYVAISVPRSAGHGAHFGARLIYLVRGQSFGHALGEGVFVKLGDPDQARTVELAYVADLLDHLLPAWAVQGMADDQREHWR